MFFGTPFHGSRFAAPGSVADAMADNAAQQGLITGTTRGLRIEQSLALKGAEQLQRCLEAQGARSAGMALSGSGDDRSNEVVSRQMHRDFLAYHLRGFAS